MNNAIAKRMLRMINRPRTLVAVRLMIIGTLANFSTDCRADLVLDISDASVQPGEFGWLDVSVLANHDATTLLGWDTELVIESDASWFRLLGVTAVVDTPVFYLLSDFRASVAADRVQAQSLSRGGLAAWLTPEDDATTLYRIQFEVAPDAPAGGTVHVGFSTRQFTNFVDDNLQPLALVRRQGTVSVSPVPEASGWMLMALATVASALCRFQRRLRQTFCQIVGRQSKAFRLQVS